MKKFTKKEQINIALMIGAVFVLMAGIPLAITGANSINGWLSDTYAFTQVENATGYYEGPLVDGEDTEGRYASVNGTSTISITEETPVWDTSADWDQVTITSTGEDARMVWNLNYSINDLLRSENYQFRMKFNGTKGLDITINAVKFDGITLTSWEVYSSHVSNGSQVEYWNWTPTQILDDYNNHDAEATDESYIQVIVEGEGDTELTTGDVIQFQFAFGGPDNAYAFSSYQILIGVSAILIVVFLLLGIGATDLWDPITKGPLHGQGTKYYRKARTGMNKRSRSRRSA
jgi:hypothetical protein